MIASYNWLQKYLKKNLPKPQDLADLLNIRSFEVENVEEVLDKDGKVIDYLLDIDVLPNRAHDSLCHLGLAREIAVLTSNQVNYEKPKDHVADFETKTDVKLEKSDCLRYITREIRNIKVGETPEDIRIFLESIGQKSINNVVDILNFVMFEMGQPMHAFDLDKMDGNNLIIRYANEGEEITTLDNREVKFSETNKTDVTNGITVIADQSGPLAIAGIKGGKKAEIDGKTINILLESANFNASKIRKSRTSLGIATDSSKRFENGLSSELAKDAIEKATSLLLEHAGTEETEISQLIDIYPQPLNDFYTGFSLEEVSRLLGVELGQKEVEDILNRLGFDYQYIKSKDEAVKIVNDLIGQPHKIGARVLQDAPDFFDCSSLIVYAYAHAGLSIPRNSIDQLVFGQEISEEEMEPGDLVFSNSQNGDIYHETVEFLPGTKFEDGVDHVGMYVGDGKVIHSTRYKGSVVMENLKESDSFGSKVVAYRRILDKSAERFVIKVPKERLDLRNSQDLIEEVCRVYGYENISDLALEKGDVIKTSKEYYYNSLIKKILYEAGYSEIMTSSFVSKGNLEVLKSAASDRPYLRTSIKENMERALELNKGNKDFLFKDQVNIFEIGKTFEKIDEKLILTLGTTGKNNLEAIKALKEAGFDLSEKSDKIVEFELDSLYKSLEGVKNEYTVAHSIRYLGLPESQLSHYEPFSIYPFAVRDIAMWVPKETAESEIVNTLKNGAGDLLIKEPYLFDRFEKDDRVSYAFRLIFQSYEKTLDDNDILPAMEKVNKLVKDKGWEVR